MEYNSNFHFIHRMKTSTTVKTSVSGCYTYNIEIRTQIQQTMKLLMFSKTLNVSYYEDDL